MIYNSHTSRAILTQDLGLDLSDKNHLKHERVNKIVQTLPGGNANRAFFQTQKRIISKVIAVSEGRDKALFKDEKHVKIKTTEKILDILYHSKDQDEVIFALDQQNAYSIDPVTHESQNILTIDYRDTELTAFVGRYSVTKNTLLLFIGDKKGVLRIFDPKEMVTLKEFQMFPDILTQPSLNIMSTCKERARNT